jgi:hypothetical protein
MSVYYFINEDSGQNEITGNPGSPTSKIVPAAADLKTENSLSGSHHSSHSTTSTGSTR